MKKPKKKPIPICPRCGATALKHITKHGIRYYHCNLWAWGKYPLVNKATHDLRILVHYKFDPIWQSGKMTRKEAYKNLAKELEIPLYRCHMKLMDKGTLKKALVIIERLKKGREETD